MFETLNEWRGFGHANGNHGHGSHGDTGSHSHTHGLIDASISFGARYLGDQMVFRHPGPLCGIIAGVLFVLPEFIDPWLELSLGGRGNERR
jgi:hypothetical protein